MLYKKIFANTKSLTVWPAYRRRKAKERTANPNIAGCAGNFYFTGKAKPLGSVYDGGNAQIKTADIARYLDSFEKEDEFIRSDEVFFALTVENVSKWVFDNGNPAGFAKQRFCPETILICLK